MLMTGQKEFSDFALGLRISSEYWKPRRNHDKDFAEEIIIDGNQSKIVYHAFTENDPCNVSQTSLKAKEILGWDVTVNRAEGMKITIVLIIV
jgi:hypothetical protein